MADAAPFRTARIDELERIPLEHGSWRPVRRPLGVTGTITRHEIGDDKTDVDLVLHLKR